MNTLFSFILVLGLLIFVHELGHFLIAKLFRVRVLKFSLGFGPKVAGKVVGDTEYVISALPLGGYVKMYGENPDDETPNENDRQASFAHKPVWQRFGIVLAGPVFNLLFTVVIFFLIFFALGLPTPVDTTRIGRVSESSPAAEAGLLAGDQITAINGLATVGWQDVLQGVKASGGERLEIEVQRDGSRLSFSIIPQMDVDKDIFGQEVDKRYMIGIMKADDFEYKSVGPLTALSSATQQTWMYIQLTAMGFYKIIQRVIPASELGGPILIAQIAGEQMRAGWLNFFYFMGLLSVNLGILNLLPIPVLDGGHLVFLTLEGIRRKPLSEKMQIAFQQMGLALLGTLMLFVFYNDILRLLQ